MRHRRRSVAIAMLLGAFAAGLGPTASGVGGVPGLEAKLLPPEQAFRFSARAVDAKTVEARFDVADGYYLYRDKLRFVAAPGGASLGAATLPAGKRKHDEFFGEVETYRGAVVVKLPVVNGTAGEAIVVIADSQGCADAGICYPPNSQQVKLALPAPSAGPGPIVEATPSRKGLFK